MGRFLAPWLLGEPVNAVAEGWEPAVGRAAYSYRPIQCSQVPHSHYTNSEVLRWGVAHAGSHSWSGQNWSP